MTPPIYLDGEPQNLEAAATDALDWLKITLEYIHHIRGQVRMGQRLEVDRDRLRRTIEAVETYLPSLKPMHRRTGEPEPEGWAVVTKVIELNRQPEYKNLCDMCKRKRRSRQYYVPINAEWLHLCKECWEKQEVRK